MKDVTSDIKEELLRLGADVAGFGDLTALPPEVRGGLPVGVSVGVCVPPEIIRGIEEAPTLEYWDYYHSGQDALDALACAGAAYIRSLGYQAAAQTQGAVRFTGPLRSALPYKTVAARAGLGWIGKCALLVTGQYGTAVWFSSILTDAPLVCAAPVTESQCGGCEACKTACPAGAVSGILWNSALDRDVFFDAQKCAAVSRVRAKELIGVDYPLCGKCIAACPRSRQYIGPAGFNQRCHREMLRKRRAG